MVTDYEILHALKAAMVHLTPGSKGGSHTEVYRIDPDAAGQALAELARAQGASAAGIAAVEEAGRALGRRFLVKVGNIRNYVVKFHGDREAVIQRHVVSEAFGPAGYNMAPTLDKVHMDCREAVREIPYFGSGTPEELFAPDVLGQIRAAMTGTCDASDDGLFLVEEDREGLKRRTAYDFFADDPYFDAQIRNHTELKRFQEFVRKNPLSAPLREKLHAFFDASMTVGLRDTLRFALGSRHPDIGWKAAEEEIRLCFDRFGAVNFLPPEINYYTVSIDLSPDEVAARAAANRDAARAFSRWLIQRMPFSWTASWSDEALECLAHAILELHFEYPVFDIDPYSGLLSSSGLRLALRLLIGTAIHLSECAIPERRNPINASLAWRAKPISDFLIRLSVGDRPEFFLLVNDLLWEVAVRGGVPSDAGGVLPFRRIDRTFYSFQERAQYPIEAAGKLETMVTLEQLLEPEGQALLENNPDVVRELVVFFVLVYRYFLDTAHVVDLRPDNVGRDLFLRGIWGYSTRNVLVAFGRDPQGRPIHVIRFVDNKDQFKQYIRAEDRGRPMGLGKYGLRLVHPLVQPAMERSIGMYVEKAARLDGIAPAKRMDVPQRIAEATNQVLRAGIDGAVVHAQAFLHDLVDDATEGIERVLRKL